MDEMDFGRLAMSLHEAISHLEFSIDQAVDANIRWVANSAKRRNQFRGHLRMAKVRLEQALEMLSTASDTAEAV